MTSHSHDGNKRPLRPKINYYYRGEFEINKNYFLIDRLNRVFYTFSQTNR